MEKIKIQEGNCISDTKNNQTLFELIGLTAPITNNKCSIAVTRMEPNGRIAKHFHKESEEIYIITSGSAMLKVNDSEFKVCTGDTVLINKLDVHEMNTSENESVEFYAITVPPFNPNDTYEL